MVTIDDLFNELATRIRTKYPKAYVIGERFSESAPRFPAISITLESSTNIRRHSTFDHKRNVSRNTVYIEMFDKDYQVLLDIADIIDECACEEYRYNRTMNQELSNIDLTLKRRILRYDKSDIV